MRKGRRVRRVLAAAAVGLFALSMPFAVFFFFVGYRMVFLPEQERQAEVIMEAAMGGTDPHAVDELDRIEAARSLAVEFAAEYLLLDPEEDEDLAQERLAGFLATHLDARDVAPAPPEDARQYVLAASPTHVRQLDGDVFEVRVSTRVIVHPVEDEADEEDGGAEGDEDEAPTPIKRLLSVYVGVDADGRAAVVEPPTLLRDAGRYAGQAGALDFSRVAAEDLEDPNLTALLDGYFSAYYGTAEAQESLPRLFAPGARVPRLPQPDLVFVEISGAELRPRMADGPNGAKDGYEPAEVGGVVFPVVYDVEVWVAARAAGGPSGGMIVNQTHLITAGRTETGDWMLLGEF